MDRHDEVQPQAGSSGSQAGQPLGVGEGTPRERLIYIPRERSCPLFSGTGEIDVRSWIEEVKSIMRQRRLTSVDQAYFIYDHLIGDAREEIKYRSQLVREDPKRVFEILIAQYSCSFSFISLKEAFYARKQLEGESLREFSHALFALMDKMIMSCPEKHIPDAAQLLRDQFMECVYDGNLSRELRRIVREHPNYDLHDLRDEAIKWEREGRLWETKTRILAPTTYSIQRTGHEKAKNDVMGSELAELRDLLKHQQIQLDQLTQQLRTSQTNSVTRPRNLQKKNLICRRCQKPGHFAKDCDNERVVVPDVNSHNSRSRLSEN